MIDLPDLARLREIDLALMRDLTADPHVCLVLQHHSAFKFPARTVCASDEARRDIELAAPCGNGVLACAHRMTLLVLGSPRVPAPADWSTSPFPRLHQNLTLLDQLTMLSASGDDVTRSWCPRRLPPVRRHPTWNKVLLLMLAPSLLPECDVLGVMDPDVELVRTAGPLWRQPPVAKWLSSSRRLFFIAREPPGGWTRGSVKDANGTNDLNNAAVNA
eukprot:1911950-Prymnesium_polylepis.1